MFDENFSQILRVVYLLSKFDCQEPEIIIFSLANLAKSSWKVLAKTHKS